METRGGEGEAGPMHHARSRALAALVGLAISVAVPGAAAALESWECDVMRSHMLDLARPLLTPEGRVIYAAKLDDSPQYSICSRLTAAHYRCVLDARSYAAAKACFEGPSLLELPAAPDVDTTAAVDLAGPPEPDPAVLAQIGAARTFAITVDDTSDSAAASAKQLVATIKGLLVAAKLKPAARGTPADLTVALRVTGTAVALPYEEISTKRKSQEYTATVLTGAVTFTLADGAQIVRPFDLESVPTDRWPISTSHPRPRDAPWGRAFLGSGGPAQQLLAVLLRSRGPAALFHVLRHARRYDGLLPFTIASELVHTPPAYLPEIRAALRDKLATVRAAAAEALGSMGEPGDLALLEKLARDRSPDVVRAAASARHLLSIPKRAPAP